LCYLGRALNLVPKSRPEAYYNSFCCFRTVIANESSRLAYTFTLTIYDLDSKTQNDEPTIMAGSVLSISNRPL
jgi:hypothetical protein